MKSGAVQRKSEGIVVPSMAATHNAVGGKGPCGDRVGGEGTREGMTGRKSRSNSPERREPIDKVRRLQVRLWKAAKQHPGRRFHALYDRIWRSDVLWEAWKTVEPGARVMPLLERSPVSRVREIRMHGLKGGPVSRLHFSEVRHRIYQCPGR